MYLMMKATASKLEALTLIYATTITKSLSFAPH